MSSVHWLAGMTNSISHSPSSKLLAWGYASPPPRVSCGQEGETLESKHALWPGLSRGSSQERGAEAERHPIVSPAPLSWKWICLSMPLNFRTFSFRWVFRSEISRNPSITLRSIPPTHCYPYWIKIRTHQSILKPQSSKSELHGF